VSKRLQLNKRGSLGITSHAHMLRPGSGYELANAGRDTRAIQAWMGTHTNIHHTVRYTELALAGISEAKSGSARARVAYGAYRA
jgi:site-specific recombinase XerD